MAITGTFGSATTATTNGSGTTVAQGAGTSGSCLTNKATNLYSGYAIQVQGLVIPANAVGAGGYVTINYELSQSCSAATVTGNTFFMAMKGITIGGAVTVPAANKSYRGNVRIRNVDNQSQIITVAHADGTAGSYLQTFSADFTMDQTVRFLTYHNELGQNSIAVKGFSAECHKLSATAAADLIPGTKIWHGVNHHFTYGGNPSNATIISAMKALKFNTLRVDWYGRSVSIGGIDNTTWITSLASAMQADGNNCTMCLLVGTQPTSASGTFASELAAYNYWYDQGSYIASLVKPLGVVLYENGNEVDGMNSAIRPNPANQGTNRSDYGLTASSATWTAFRGAMRGTYDGIKSVHTAAQVGSNAFCNADIYVSDCLWDGVNGLDGTTGWPQVRWDWTNWHFYTEGDATDCQYTGLTGTEARFNLLKYIHNSYGKPIMITEWNPSDAVTASAVTRLNSWMSTWYSQQVSLGIAGVYFYDWFNAPYNIAIAAGSPTGLNVVGQALIDFISAHPALR